MKIRIANKGDYPLHSCGERIARMFIARHEKARGLTAEEKETTTQGAGRFGNTGGK